MVEVLIEAGASFDFSSKFDLSIPLLKATIHQNFSIVQKLLDHGADVNVRTTSTGHSALHLSCMREDEKTIRILLLGDANVNAVNYIDGSTPFLIATQVSNMQIVELLINNGANIHFVREDGLSAVHIAAKFDRTDILKLLYRKGIDLDTPRADGWTPLMIASAEGHINSVQYLLSKRVGAKQRVKWVTPLILAKLNHHSKVVELLKTTDTEKINLFEITIISIVYLYSFTIGIFNKKKIAISLGQRLLDASQYGNDNVVQQTIEFGADPNYIGSEGYSAIYIACVNGRLSTVKRLLELGADINFKTDTGITPLVVAEKSNYQEIAEYLLMKGASDIQ